MPALHEGRGDKETGESSADKTEEHDECEVQDYAAAEDHQDDDREERGDGGKRGSGKSRIDGAVHQLGICHLGMHFGLGADAVEDDDCVVQRVTDDCQEARDCRQGEFSLEDQEEDARRDDYVVDDCDDSRHAVHPLEAECEVEAGQREGEDRSLEGVGAELAADRGPDLVDCALGELALGEGDIQLLAEALGKRLDKQGNVVNYGRTPIVAVGTTDMHAQTQEHQEGPQDKVVQFVSVENWPDDVTVPHLYDEYPKLAAFSGLPLSQILEAARSSNAEALAGDGRPSANYILPALTPYHLGELMFMLCLSIAYEGEYANVDAFNQPGVEVYKKFLGGRLKKLQEK